MSNIDKSGSSRDINRAVSSSSTGATRGSNFDRLVEWFQGQEVNASAKEKGAEVFSVVGILERIIEEADSPKDVGVLLRQLNKRGREGVVLGLERGERRRFEIGELEELKAYLEGLPVQGEGETKVVPDIDVRVSFGELSTELVRTIKGFPGERAVKMVVEMGSMRELRDLTKKLKMWNGELEDDSEGGEDEEQEVVNFPLGERGVIREVRLGGGVVKAKTVREAEDCILEIDRILNVEKDARENRIPVRVGIEAANEYRVCDDLGLILKRGGEDDRDLEVRAICDYVDELVITGGKALIVAMGVDTCEVVELLMDIFVNLRVLRLKKHTMFKGSLLHVSDSVEEIYFHAWDRYTKMDFGPESRCQQVTCDSIAGKPRLPEGVRFMEVKSVLADLPFTAPKSLRGLSVRHLGLSFNFEEGSKCRFLKIGELTQSTVTGRVMNAGFVNAPESLKFLSVDIIDAKVLLSVPKSVERFVVNELVQGEFLFKAGSQCKLVGIGNVAEGKHEMCIDLPDTIEVLSVGNTLRKVVVRGGKESKCGVMSVGRVGEKGVDLVGMGGLRCLIIDSIEDKGKGLRIVGAERLEYLQVGDRVYTGERLRAAKEGKQRIRSYKVEFE